METLVLGGPRSGTTVPLTFASIEIPEVVSAYGLRATFQTLRTGVSAMSFKMVRYDKHDVIIPGGFTVPAYVHPEALSAGNVTLLALRSMCLAFGGSEAKP